MLVFLLFEEAMKSIDGIVEGILVGVFWPLGNRYSVKRVIAKSPDVPLLIVENPLVEKPVHEVCQCIVLRFVFASFFVPFVLKRPTSII